MQANKNEQGGAINEKKTSNFYVFCHAVQHGGNPAGR